MRRKFRKQRWLIAAVPAFAPMLVSGFWHDFGVYMVAWGGLHGLYQAFEQLKNIWRPSPPPAKQPGWRQFISMVFVFGLAVFAWTAFGSGGAMKTLNFLRALALSGVEPVLKFVPTVLLFALLVATSYLIDIFQYRAGDEYVFLKMPLWARSVLLALVMFGFILHYALGAKLVADFVYQGF